MVSVALSLQSLNVAMANSPNFMSIDPSSNSRSPSPPQDKVLTLRALVSTKDADIINLAELRDRTGVDSNVISGVHKHVLTVTGPVHAVANVISSLSVSIWSDNFQAYTQLVSANPSSPVNSIRLLISHNLMGTIIGRQGLKIKTIQDTSGARVIAAKAMLPQSTERTVDVQGTVEAIGLAIEEIGKCLLEDGTKITEIRRLSGSKISIAKTPHDETGERMFTIIGTPESNEKALFLLYHQLDSERKRRDGQDARQQTEPQE